MIARFCLIALLVVGVTHTRAAEPTTQPGEVFENQSARVKLIGPAGFQMTRGALGSTELVRFTNEDAKQVLKLTRVQLERDKPLPLTTWRDKDGEQHPGMLEFTTDQFKTDTPSAEILRQEVIEVNDLQVGLMDARFSFGMETTLQQQAIISAGPGNIEYFLLSMNSPAKRKGSLEEDPIVRAAVEAFQKTLNSFQLVDSTAIREDQESRLFRTRTLFLSLTPDRYEHAIKKEQWLRYLKDGKDIGYSYVTEEIAYDLPRKRKVETDVKQQPGILIGARTRMVPAAGEHSDGESWLFCTYDRNYEAWSSVSYTENPKTGKATAGELGSSHRRTKPIADPDRGKKLIGQTGISMTEQYDLEVTKLGRNVPKEPILRELPPFYLPQAVGQLLPRIAPMREARTYAFATWVSDAGQLMYRYIDVGSESDVMLNGKRIHAVPVKDRVGLEGSVTTHYVTFKGEYLGSVNTDAHLMILPTDAATLESIWKNVNLTKPAEVEQK